MLNSQDEVVDKYFGELIETIDPVLAGIAADLIDAIEDPYSQGHVVGMILYEGVELLATCGMAKVLKGPRYVARIALSGTIPAPTSLVTKMTVPSCRRQAARS